MADDASAYIVPEGMASALFDLPRAFAKPAAGDVADRVAAELAEAEAKAWSSLAKYKFVMFGYWAGVWVHLNRVSGRRHPNPFANLVKIARQTHG